MKILTDRKEMAQALNFGKYPVLTYNMDELKGSGAVVMRETRNHGTLRYKTTLYCGKKTADDGVFYLLTHATMLTATVDVNDWLKCAEYANAPVIESGQEVAILMYSKKHDVSVVRIVKAGKCNPDYSTATTFTEI